MHEFAQGFFNLEQPAPGSELAPGSHVLRGWIVGRDGRHFVDVRVRVGDAVLPAIHGHLRPDLATYFHHPTPHLPAQFETQVHLTPGAVDFVFEALEVAGNWIAVHRERFTVTGPPVPRAHHPAEAVIEASEQARIFRHVLRAAAATPSVPWERLACQVIDTLPWRRHLQHPPLPWHGFFHEPAVLTRSLFGRVLVDGYLFHEHQRVIRVLATFDLVAWQPLEYGTPSPIAPDLFPDQPNARQSRATGYVDLPSQLPAPCCLRLYAELPDGSIHLCAVQRTGTFDQEDEKRPLVAMSRWRFWRAARAVRRQLRARGAVLGDGPEWNRARAEEWRHLHTHATPHRPAVPFEAPPVASAAPRPLGPVTLVTHNLNYEGAPLFLLEYARHLATAGGARLTVVSAADGPLGPRFAQLGAQLVIVDTTPLNRADSDAQWRQALAGIASQVNLTNTHLVVANTLAAYWGVHLAHHAMYPVLFYIHESTTPPAFWLGQTAGATLRHTNEAFALANRVSFLTTTTRRYYEPLATRPNFDINPGWIDLGAIDAFRRDHPRDSLQAKLGLPPERRLVVNLGTVCERKGQHMFARAVELLWRRHPELAAGCDFLMVGANATLFDHAMEDLVAGLNRPNLRLISTSATPYDYLGAADLFVCSSYEESFPRVVLEAMGFGLPILSTDVHGIPEIARSEQEAMLVPPGNPSALTDGLARLLADHQTAARFAAAAETRVRECFSATRLLPRHLALAHTVIDDAGTARPS